MIRKCMTCKKIMGVKAPWFSLAVTVGICLGCKKAGIKMNTCFLTPIGKVSSNKSRGLFKRVVEMKDTRSWKKEKIEKKR